MNNIDRTIKNLKKIICDPNCSSMNISTVKGYLGELYVYKKLREEGIEPIQKGNQGGYDLEFDLGDKNFKIDVKLSTLKEEVNGVPKFWGWALNNKRKSRITCTHFICVAVNDDLDPIKYYIINANAKNLKCFKGYFKQFSNVTHGFALLPPKSTLNKISQGEYKMLFKKCHSLLKDGVVIGVPPNQKLSKKLIKI